MSDVDFDTGAAETKKRKDKEPLRDPIGPPKGWSEQVVGAMGAWDEPGKIVKGRFLEIEESRKYPGRHIVSLANADGVIEAWPCPVILHQLLRGVAPHTPIAIYYRGDDEKDVKHFQLFKQEGAK